MTSVVDQIATLERERVRLEGILAADDNWRSLEILKAANGSAPPDAGDIEQRLRRALAANPYYSARVKIVEAITILRRLGEPVRVNGREKPAESLPGPSRSPLGLPLGVPLFGESGGPAPVFQPPRSKSGPESSPEVLRAEVSAEGAAPVVARVAAPPVSVVFDDLTRISGVTPDLARRLQALGTTLFDEIAAWTSFDVSRVSTALAVGRRISKENWIEQAALLARARRSEALASEPTATVAAESASEPPGPAAPAPGAAVAGPAAQVDIAPVETADAAIAPVVVEAAPPGAVTEPARISDAMVPRDGETPAAAATPVEPGLDSKPREEEPLSPASVPTTLPEPDAVSPRDWLARRRGARAASLVAADAVPPLTPSLSPEPIFAPDAPATDRPPPLPTTARMVNYRAEETPDGSADPLQAAPDPDIRRRLREARAAARREMEAEVSIVTPAPPPGPISGPQHGASPLRSLRRRLLRIDSPEAIDGATHAGYRDTIEEASVEIVRPGEAQAGFAESTHVEPRLVSRFLKALKGQPGDH